MNDVLQFTRGYGFVIVLALVYAAFSVAAPSFFGFANLIDVANWSLYFIRGGCGRRACG